MRRASDVGARGFWFIGLAAAFVLVLALNLPGHLSVDSVISLAEGRSGQRITWGPPMYSAILGFFDRMAPGTSLYVAGSLLLLLASWAALPSLRPRMWWTGPLALALAIALPQLAIYQAIVWKDVLYANLSIAGFVVLASAFRRWDAVRVRLPLLLLAALLLALGCLVRQNGFVGVFAAAVAIGWMGWRRGGWRPGVLWALAGVAVPLLIMTGLDAATPVREAPGDADHDRGVRLVQQYDLVAALAAHPSLGLPLFEATAAGKAKGEARLAALRRDAPRVYSPVRSDTLDATPALGEAMVMFDDPTVSAQWAQVVTSDPLGYIHRRLGIYRWVFATPVIDNCLPVHLGVAGPPKQMSYLHLATRFSQEDGKLYNYVTWFLDTPAMSHVAYAIAALAVGLILLFRRDPADLAIAGLMGASLLFAASFAAISLACDYRYLYFLDLSAITGLLYLAVDPRLRRA